MPHPLCEKLGTDSQLVSQLCEELDVLIEKIQRSTGREVKVVVETAPVDGYKNWAAHPQHEGIADEAAAESERA